MATIEFSLDGKNVRAQEGETLLDVARRMGKNIPSLCHDPRLTPFTSCFLCLVEMEGKPGYVPSCATKPTPGMKIITDSEEIRRARKLCLELLLSAHDADCVAPCRMTCPDNIDIQTYIAQIAAGDYLEALKTIKLTNPFPSVCGRVCPHTCEISCRRNKVDEAVAINPLKRFVADIDRDSKHPYLPTCQPDSGKKVAVVGAGPAGLTAAYYLRQKGHRVHVFEMNKHPGGMLRYGIPRYRLPDDVLEREIGHILALGIELSCNQKLGRDFSTQKLRQQGFDAVFLGLGAWASSSMRVAGEDKPGIMAGIDYLWKIASDQKVDLGKKVVVVGGGNTAIDAARTARRAGCDVTILYRRTRKEMPAEAYEVDEAEQEGVAMHFLAAPVELLGQERVEKIRAIKMELGEPDASGRRRPVPVEGSQFEIEVDTVIAAIGQKPDPKSWQEENAPGTTRWNTVQANERTYQTEIEWIFTAGDCLTGASTAVEAIAGGRRAAISIDLYLKGQKPLPIGKPFSDSIARLEDMEEEFFAEVPRIARVHGAELSVEQRLDNFSEVELGITEEQALCESGRCLACGCTSVDSCTLRSYCEEYGVELDRFDTEFHHRPINDDHPFILYDPNKCIQCGRCVRICDEQQGTGALGFVQRGFETSIQPALGQPLLATDCDACGQCVSTCPTGALDVKRALPQPGPYVTQNVPVVCGFCSVACRLELHMAGKHYVQARAALNADHSAGNLCVDGSFGHRYLETLQRIDKPMLKSAEQQLEVDWTKAAQAAAAGLLAAKERGVAVLVNGPLTNEDAYLLARFTRGKLNSSRFAFLDEKMPSTTGSRGSALGLLDLDQADFLFVVGEDPMELAPVAGLAIRRRAKQIANTYAMTHKAGRLDSEMRYALRVDPQRLAVVFSALSAYLVKPKPELLHDAALSIAVKPSLLAQLATSLKKAKQPVVVCSGPLTSKSLDALQTLLKASKHKDRLLELRQVGNSLGRERMGLSSRWLPGGKPASDKHARKLIEKLWGESCAADPVEPDKVLQQVSQGKLGAVVVVNSDPKGMRLPAAAIHSDLFCVVFDLVRGEWSQRADVYLPSGGLAQSQGTVLTLDGQLLPTNAACPPVAGKTFFQALGAIADEMGASIPLAKPHHVWDELGRL